MKNTNNECHTTEIHYHKVITTVKSFRQKKKKKKKKKYRNSKVNKHIIMNLPDNVINNLTYSTCTTHPCCVVFFQTQILKKNKTQYAN